MDQVSVTHSDMVRQLAKPGSSILADMTPSGVATLHHVVKQVSY